MSAGGADKRRGSVTGTYAGTAATAALAVNSAAPAVVSVPTPKSAAPGAVAKPKTPKSPGSDSGAKAVKTTKTSPPKPKLKSTAEKLGGSAKIKGKSFDPTKAKSKSPSKAAAAAGDGKAKGKGKKSKSKSKSKSPTYGRGAPDSAGAGEFGGGVDGGDGEDDGGVGSAFRDDSEELAYQSGSMLCQADAGIRTILWDDNPNPRRALLHVAAGRRVLGWDVAGDRLVHTIAPQSNLHTAANTAAISANTAAVAAADSKTAAATAALAQQREQSLTVTCIDVRLNCRLDFSAAPGTGAALTTPRPTKGGASSARSAAAPAARTASQAAEHASREADAARVAGATEQQLALLQMESIGMPIDGMEGADTLPELKAKIAKIAADAEAAAQAEADVDDGSGSGSGRPGSGQRRDGISDFVAIGLSSGEIAIWDLRTLECVRQWTAHGLSTAPAHSHGGIQHYAAVAARDATASVSGVKFVVAPPFSSNADGVPITDAGPNSTVASSNASHVFVYSTGHDGYFRARDLHTDRTVHAVSTCSCPLTAMCVNPADPALVYAGSSDGCVRSLDLRALTTRIDFIAQSSGEPASPIRTLCLAPASKSLPLGGSDSPAALAAAAAAAAAQSGSDTKRSMSGKTTARWSPPRFNDKPKRKKNVVVLPSSQYVLLVAHGNGHLRSWDLRNKKEFKVFVGCGDAINALVFDSATGRVFAASDDKRIHVYDLATATLVDTLAGHTHGVTALSIVQTVPPPVIAAPPTNGETTDGADGAEDGETANGASNGGAKSSADAPPPVATTSAAPSLDLITSSYDCSLRAYNLVSLAVSITNRALKKQAALKAAAEEYAAELARAARRKSRARNAKRKAKLAAAKNADPGDTKLLATLGITLHNTGAAAAATAAPPSASATAGASFTVDSKEVPAAVPSGAGDANISL